MTAGRRHDGTAAGAGDGDAPLPTRRNAELVLLCFAAVITVAALLIVEANQDRSLHWDLASYGLAFLTLFGFAHLAIRRSARSPTPCCCRWWRCSTGWAW
ncbi:cell division RodA domain protein [Mycobacterium kansasii]|uniref:Cell division RodA domain protein n=1 Tax=Mycobacterium kansasii TaxID=1768 RepID=A0A1V3X913_MYCKA|nr:cell division RodA domain protein [Mycobacterium kansasii]